MNRCLPRVRRAMERMGPAGLQHGELNDRPLFDTIVQILPGGREAISRGIELGMLGEADKRTAHWEFTVFRNRFVKEGGLWKLKERVKTNGFSAVGASPLTGAIKTTRAAARPAVSSATLSERLVEARRRWARSMAYDGTENVSSAYGYYIDDFQWPQMGACSQLTWSHYRALMRVADQAARSWYVQEAAAQGWPVRTLLRQISSFAYERTLRSDKPAAAGRRRRKQPEQPSIEPRDFIKDPYVLEFLEVKDHAGLHESRFEQAIIDRLSGVHARAGKGFCICRSPVRTRFSTRAGSYSRPSTAHIFRRSLQCVKPPAPGNRTPPGSTLYGLTLAKFKAALQPGHDARAEIEDLQKRLRAAISRRDVADVRSMRILRGVAFGVKGDPDHTEDGALYAATGFVRKSARRKRRRQKK